MIEMRCEKCNTKFILGVNGVSINGDWLCDKCANGTRTLAGEFYENPAPYEIRRPLTSVYKNAASPRPGDFAIVHPHRKG